MQPSVEPTVWAQGEFIKNNFPNLSWNPFWYLGYPFRFSGPPIFVYLLAFLSKIFGVSAPEVEKWFVLILLSIIPVSLYIFASFLLKNRLWAFLASVFFLVVPSFGYVFPQAYSSGFNAGLGPWHFVGFLTYGGGQRILGLAILPLVFLFFWQALDKWKHFWIVLAVTFSSFLFLSDYVTSISFLIGALVILISLGWDKLGRALILLVLVFLLVSFWYTPSYIQNILFSPSLAGKPLKDILTGLIRFFIVLLPSLLAVLALKKRRVEVSFCILWLFLFLFLTLLYFLTDPDFLAEYSRFFPEIDVGIALAFGFLGVVAIGSKFYRKTLLVGGLIVLVAVAFFARLIFGLPIVHVPLKVEPEITDQLENISKGQRVYLSGSTAFWFNFFAPDIPQVRGGVDQAAINPFWAHASYQIREGESLQLSEDWLRALRVGFVVVHDKDSNEYYHDFKYPEKFTKFDQVFGNNGGDRIYRVQGSELARIVKKDGLEGLKKPKDGSDSENLGRYISWLDYDQQRLPQVSWISPSQIAVKASDLKEGEGISLGVTWDPGWDAQCKMQNAKCKIRILKDPIGNIFVDPATAGDLEIILRHGSRIDNWFGYVLSLGAFLALIFFPKLEPKLKKLTPESLRKEFEEEE